MYLGFDTSNYTTSVCTYDGENINSKRSIIPIKQGERGIRQSDGVFYHLKTLPKLYNELDIHNVSAVGVSTRPRNQDGSYMPVFLAGEGYAKVVAKTLGVPLYEFSHQDGHIAAGILSGECTELLEGDFLSVHLSGGTTEILKCRYNSHGFDAEIIGKTLDISAGQLIDRSGVYMNMPFPSGKYIEAEAKKSDKILKMPISVKDTDMNFSGTENKVLEYLKTESIPNISRSVLYAVSKTLIKAINTAVLKTGINRVMLVGGVASNKILREEFKAEINADIYFAKPEFSTDNALGIAYLTYLKNETHTP